MSAKPVLFVTGASGNIGFATVAALSSKYAEKVEIRAGVRNPDHEKAEKIRNLPGVQVVRATMGDASLSETLQGVHVLFIVTPPVENDVEVVMATAEEAKKAGVKHIVAIGRDRHGEGPQVDGEIPKLGVPYTVVILPFFMENYWAFKDSIVSQGKIFNPVDPEKSYSTVVVEDAGKAVAEILVNPMKYANETLNIASDRHSYYDVAKAFQDVLKKDVEYVRVPYEATKQAMLGQGIEEWLVDLMFWALKLIDSGSPALEKVDPGLYKQITGEDPTNLKTWVTKNAGGFQ